MNEIVKEALRERLEQAEYELERAITNVSNAETRLDNAKAYRDRCVEVVSALSEALNE